MTTRSGSLVWNISTGRRDGKRSPKPRSVGDLARLGDSFFAYACRAKLNYFFVAHRPKPGISPARTFREKKHCFAPLKGARSCISRGKLGMVAARAMPVRGGLL